MKAIAILSAIASLAIAATAVAAPVTMTFQNLSTTTAMVVSHVNACGTLLPTPTTVFAGKTSPASSTNCGAAASASHVTYTMGAKSCVFHISTIYTPPDVLIGSSGYWTPSSSTTPSGGAICNVVSKDISHIFTTGAYAAVFSMK